nr:GTP-binding protein [Candidatus Sigynarchaeota archaeon]
MVKVKNVKEIENMVVNSPFDVRRIFSVTAHVQHGKTTMVDYLIKRAGLIRESDAGALRVTNSEEDEIKRGITIFNSIALLNYQYQGKEYIFQINDTPGHISFTGEVSRALRGSDGAILLVDALEGVMTQTETNIRLSVGTELCKPILYINKADRLISELRIQAKEFYQRIDRIVKNINQIIEQVQPKGKDWTVSFTANSVAVGSGKDGWGFNMSVLKAKNIKPDLVFEKYAAGDVLWLRKNLALDDVILQMVIEHLPNPLEAAAYRIPAKWPGDIESELGKSLLRVDRNGQLFGMITKISIDQKSFRPTVTGRVFSGTLKPGDSLFLMGRKERVKIKRLGVMELDDLMDLPEVPAGNLFACFGFICPAGESFVSGDLTDEQALDVTPFEQIKYVAEPVVSQSLKPKNPQDIGKLADVVSKWVMADNTATFKKDKDSGEYILSGIDPLQIEILMFRITKQVDVIQSDPIIVYREKPTIKSREYHTKSSNGHNRILMYLEPLDDQTVGLLAEGRVTIEQKEKDRAKVLRDEAGWDPKESRNIWDIYEQNMFVNGTHGLQRLERIKSYCCAAFREWVENGPLAKEPVTGMKVTFTDATIHEDTAHTGYNEIAGMTVAGLSLCFLTAKPKLFEPIQRVEIKTPTGTEGSIIGILSAHRGSVLNMIPDESSGGVLVIIQGKVPAAETLKIADEFRSATQGKAFFSYQFFGFEPVPDNQKAIMDIRKRKKLPQEMPSAATFERFIYARK